MKLTFTKILHYGLLLMAAYIVYTWFVQKDDGNKYDHHPRNTDKLKDKSRGAKGDEGHKYADKARHIKDEFENVKDSEWAREYKVVKNKPPIIKVKIPPADGEEKAKENLKVKGDVKTNQKDIKVKVKEKEKQLEREEDMGQKNERNIDNGKLKLKKKAGEGEDILKQLNDAALKGDPDVHKQIDKLADHKNVKIPKLKRGFGDEHDDIETAEDKKQRRKRFFDKVAKLAEKEEMAEDKHIHEKEDNFPFITVSNSELYQGTLSFIRSVQYNFPESEIGIFNLGLSDEELEYIDSLCKVEIIPNILPLYPEHVQAKISEKMWRPMVLHIAANRFGHFVYIEPMRMLKQGVNMKGHFDLSRKGGAAMFGNFKSYSSFVVTNPEMYYYLAIDVRKLQRIQHMEINMMIMHNSNHLRHFFTRWLVQCTLEEYCIAPPGSQRKCNMNLYPNSKKYADCHRYDESIINILLASWHKYDVDHYAAHDAVTQYYDGRDVRSLLNQCKPQKEL